MSAITEIIKDLVNEAIEIDGLATLHGDMYVRAEAEILASQWTKVEDGLPGGEVKMDWLVARPDCMPYISQHHTGDELAIIFKAAHTSPKTQYHPITAPGQ